MNISSTHRTVRLPVSLGHSSGLLSTVLRYKQTRMSNTCSKFVVTPRRTQTWRGPSTQHLMSLGSPGPHLLLRVPSRDVIAWVPQAPRVLCFRVPLHSSSLRAIPGRRGHAIAARGSLSADRSPAWHRDGPAEMLLSLSLLPFLPSLFPSLFLSFLQLETDSYCSHPYSSLSPCQPYPFSKIHIVTLFLSFPCFPHLTRMR